MDELGSALRHSDEPNFRVAPFLFMPEGNLASAVRLSLFSFLDLCFDVEVIFSCSTNVSTNLTPFFF